MKTKINILTAAIILGGAAMVAPSCADHLIYQDGDTVYSKEPLDFGISTNYFDFDGNGGTQSMNVTASGTWSTSGVASWLSLSPESGSGSSTVSVTAEPNPDLSSRTSVFNLSSRLSEDFTVNQSVTVTQSYLSPYIQWTGDNYITVWATTCLI